MSLGIFPQVPTCFFRMIKHPFIPSMCLACSSPCSIEDGTSDPRTEFPIEVAAASVAIISPGEAKDDLENLIKKLEEIKKQG